MTNRPEMIETEPAPVPRATSGPEHAERFSPFLDESPSDESPPKTRKTARLVSRAAFRAREIAPLFRRAATRLRHTAFRARVRARKRRERLVATWYFLCERAWDPFERRMSRLAHAVSLRADVILNEAEGRFYVAAERRNPLASGLLRIARAVRRASEAAIDAGGRACRALYAFAVRSVRRARACARAAWEVAALIVRLAVGVGFFIDHVFLRRHMKAALIAVAVCFAAAVTAASAYSYATAYEYGYNGNVLGYVKDKQTVYATVDLVGTKLAEAYDAEINIDGENDIKFTRVVLSGETVDSRDDVLRRLTYMKDMNVTGYRVFADGKPIGVFDSKRHATEFLEQVQDTVLGGNTRGKYLSVGFAEQIDIRKVDTKLTLLQKPDDVLDYVMTGAVEQHFHEVEKGQTMSQIAGLYGLTTSEFMALNPDVVPERLQIGRQLKLERVVPLLTVETSEIVTYTEVMPFEIVQEESAAMFKGEKKIKTPGVKGERDVTAQITRRNGTETARVEISATITLEPGTQVEIVGTKDPPPLIGTGVIKYPMSGRLTSTFGRRWGRMHNGIDLAARTGTAIRAADGGKVTFSGWNGALGYTVIIDHGGNRRTLYGHCSKLLVKVGEKVYQGQHIANVGNTGNSTGPHLHFEVHENGTPKNPLNYLR